MSAGMHDLLNLWHVLSTEKISWQSNLLYPEKQRHFLCDFQSCANLYFCPTSEILYMKKLNQFDFVMSAI